MKSVAKLNSYYETLKDWKWRFGETPKFTHTLEERFSWGGMEVHLDSHKGIITDCVIYSDSLHPEMIELLTASLCQTLYSVDAVKSAVDNVKKQLPMIVEELDEFCSWLVKQIA